jgi:hypothetical protein
MQMTRHEATVDLLEHLGFFGIVLMFFGVFLYKEITGRSAIKALASLSQKVKQLIILVVIAAWYAVCLIYFSSEYTSADSAFDAVIYTTPILAFGSSMPSSSVKRQPRVSRSVEPSALPL